MTKRKKYSKEFKLDAIALVVEQNYSQAEASRNLSVNPNMLGRWIVNRGRKASRVICLMLRHSLRYGELEYLRQLTNILIYP